MKDKKRGQIQDYRDALVHAANNIHCFAKPRKAIGPEKGPGREGQETIGGESIAQQFDAKASSKQSCQKKKNCETC